MKKMLVLSIIVMAILNFTSCASMYYATNPDTKEEYQLGKKAGEAERRAAEKIEAVAQGYNDGRSGLIGASNIYVGAGYRSGSGSYIGGSYASGPQCGYGGGYGGGDWRDYLNRNRRW
jgi:hypothetical protein